MAGEKNPKSAAASPRTPGGRTTPVLVPQGVLAGQPDVPLDRPVTTVGSNEKARLHLVSRTVSSGHAIFVNSAGTTYVADMASRTGVLVNGKLVKDAELKTGDRVQIGKFVFRYRSPANVAPVAAAPQSPAAAVIVVGSPAVLAQGRTVIIGRRETSGIAIPGDSGVSAAHAVIFQIEGRWCIRDLASRTGTHVNGAQIHQQELKFGDRIVVGSTNILFQPGAAKGVDPEDSFAPDIPADFSGESPVEEFPLNEMAGFEPGATDAPEPVPVEAPEVDDAIPLGDWRSSIAAEPGEAPVDGAAEVEVPLEMEPVPQPVAVEAEPVPGEIAEQVTEPPVLDEAEGDLPFADEVPSAEPLPVEPVSAEADPAEEFAFAEEAPMRAVEPPMRAVEPPMELAVKKTHAVEAVEPEIEFADEPVSDVDEPEPAQKAPIPSAIAAEAEPVANIPTPAPAPHRTPAAVKAPVVAAPVPVVEPLLGDVEEFVFVPASEHVDPNAVPDVIFWGDPEIDSVTETVVTQSGPVVPPAVQDRQPPADAEGESPGEDGPSDPPSGPPPVSPPDSNGTPAEPATDEAERSGPSHRIDYASVAEIVPEHHGEPAVAVDALPPLDLTEVAMSDLPDAAPVEIEAVHHSIDLHEPRFSTAASDAGRLNAVVNVDRVEAEEASAEPSAGSSDVSVESPEIEAPKPEYIASASLEAKHIEAEHVPLATLPTDELTAPVVDDRDEFFTPLSPALEEAFRAVRSWNDAPADGDAAPFEVIKPFSPDAQESWEAAPMAVDLLEPHEALESVDLDPEAESFDIEMTEPVEESSVAAELEQPEVETDAPAESSVESAGTEIECPVLDSTAAGTEQTAELSAAWITDQPWVSLTSTEDAANALAELYLPQITGVDAPTSANGSATVNVDLDTPVASWLSTQSESVAEAELLDVPDLDEFGSVSGLTTGADAMLDVSVVEAAVSAGEEIGSAELDLPQISGIAPEAVAPTDAEVMAETVDFVPSAAEDDEIELAEAEDSHDPASSVTETPPTTDFSGVVSVDMDAVSDESALDEPVEESIRMSEDGPPPVQAVAEVSEPLASDDTDLDFLDFGETEVEPAAENPPVGEPAAEPLAPEAPAGQRNGPSLFGFEFEGGSFLGGMPISLAEKSAIPKLPVPLVPPAPISSPAFDVRATPPSGLGSMVAPAPAAAPKIPSHPLTPPRPTMRSSVPPSITRSPGSVTSLSGLVSEARSASGPPVIPPVVKSIAGNTAAAGVGLTGNIAAAGLASRSVEVFSQLSAPIGVEVFGGRPGNPDQFTVPDIRDTTELEPVAEESAAEQQSDPAVELASATDPAPNVRWWRAPLWISLMIIIPVLAWIAVPHVVHEVSSFTGRLAFSGLKEQQQQQPIDFHNFVETQKALLVGPRSEEIRLGAEAILLKDGHRSGFTADPSQFAQAVQTQDFIFSSDHVEFKLEWPDPVMARAQVDAVLLALAEKDQGLVDAKHQALLATDDAKTKLDAINADLAKLTTEYHTEANKASDKPDGASVSQNQQDVTGLTDEYNSAHAMRVASQSVLAELKAQDPAKPVDPDSDKEIVDLKRRVDLLNEQIRLAKSKGGVSATAGTGVGTDIGAGATTQPDSDAGALLKVMQEQADMWSGKIQRRRDELAALAAIPADQRAVNLASAIENLSVKITGLQKNENDLKTRLDAAKGTAAKLQQRTADSKLAEASENQLYGQIQQKNAECQAAADNCGKLETAYDNSITVAGQSPAKFNSVTNYRRIAVLVISILAWLLFGRLALGELLRPRRVVSGSRPVAAPLANPPLRVIPWPQPHQLQGLKSDGA